MKKLRGNFLFLYHLCSYSCVIVRTLLFRYDGCTYLHCCIHTCLIWSGLLFRYSGDVCSCTLLQYCIRTGQDEAAYSAKNGVLQYKWPIIGNGKINNGLSLVICIVWCHFSIGAISCFGQDRKLIINYHDNKASCNFIYWFWGLFISILFYFEHVYLWQC